MRGGNACSRETPARGRAECESGSLREVLLAWSSRRSGPLRIRIMPHLIIAGELCPFLCSYQHRRLVRILPEARVERGLERGHAHSARFFAKGNSVWAVL